MINESMSPSLTCHNPELPFGITSFIVLTIVTAIMTIAIATFIAYVLSAGTDEGSKNESGKKMR
ncbi:hypothetical protein J1614_005794 [Plenodomus biglobosus]|nr:hypothetical protein J1614_005794 [Plenodomus biglobosus]